MEVVLASASPRRRELMSLIIDNFISEAADVDENGIGGGQSPGETSLVLARAKALAMAEKKPTSLIIGCDTVVELGGALLGKPSCPEEAFETICALSGKSHFVHTGVCIIRPGKLEAAEFIESTKVFFRNIPTDAIHSYVKTAEPYDKAGAYGIQGWAAKYIPKICGCYYNVMGLPVSALREQLEKISLSF